MTNTDQLTELRALRGSVANLRTERDEYQQAAVIASRYSSECMRQLFDQRDGVGEVVALLADLKHLLPEETSAATRTVLGRAIGLLTYPEENADRLCFQTEPYHLHPERVAEAARHDRDQCEAATPPEVAALFGFYGVQIKVDNYTSALIELRTAADKVGRMRRDLEEVAEHIRLSELYPGPAEGAAFGLFWMGEDTEVYIAPSHAEALAQYIADTGETPDESGEVDGDAWGTDEATGEPLTLYQVYAQATDGDGGLPLKPFQIWTQYN